MHDRMQDREIAKHALVPHQAEIEDEKALNERKLAWKSAQKRSGRKFRSPMKRKVAVMRDQQRLIDAKRYCVLSLIPQMAMRPFVILAR